MLAICVCTTGLFMMSFDVKNENYGESKEFCETTTLNANPEKAAITGALRFLGRVAYNAVAHMTPELEQMSYTLMGVKLDDQPIDNNQESKVIKLEKLD